MDLGRWWRENVFTDPDPVALEPPPGQFPVEVVDDRPVHHSRGDTLRPKPANTRWSTREERNAWAARVGLASDFQ